MTRGCLQTKQQAFDIDAKYPVPFTFGNFQKRLNRPGARVVDQYVKRPQLLHGTGLHAGRRIRFGDVAFNYASADTGIQDLAGSLTSFAAIQIRDGDSSTFAGKGERDSPAKALRAA